MGAVHVSLEEVYVEQLLGPMDRSLHVFVICASYVMYANSIAHQVSDIHATFSFYFKTIAFPTSATQTKTMTRNEE